MVQWFLGILAVTDGSMKCTVGCTRYQWQQNTLYPKSGRFCETNFLKILIGSQPIIEGRSLICGG